MRDETLALRKVAARLLALVPGQVARIRTDAGVIVATGEERAVLVDFQLRGRGGRRGPEQVRLTHGQLNALLRGAR